MPKKPINKPKTNTNQVTAKTSSGSLRRIDEIESLLKLMEQYQLGELLVEEGSSKTHLKKQSAPQPHYIQSAPVAQTTMVQASPAPVVTAAAAPLAASLPKPAVPKEDGNANHKKIHSPLVGTFYRSPSPTAESYVKEGQVVKKGQTLCIVEAMKLMNEIEAEFSGKIVSILVETGQPVEFGEPLFIIET